MCQCVRVCVYVGGGAWVGGLVCVSHSEHRFPAPFSLKEGCRKPVLGVCVCVCVTLSSCGLSTDQLVISTISGRRSPGGNSGGRWV